MFGLCNLDFFLLNTNLNTTKISAGMKNIQHFFQFFSIGLVKANIIKMHNDSETSIKM